MIRLPRGSRTTLRGTLCQCNSLKRVEALLADDCVGLAQCFEAVAGDGTQAANAQASRGAAVYSMAPAVSLRQRNQVAALDNSPGHRLSGDGPDTGSTRSLEMSGGLSSIFQRVAVFKSFRKQNQSNDVRLSATHFKTSDLPPLVWT